jgi:hypothetical protein
MIEQEVKEQMGRITRYRELERIRNEMYAALTKVTEDWKGIGPSDQGPFTGNTRESRRVRSMHVWFTKTQGGADAVDIEIPTMHIEASALGQSLASMLRAKIASIEAEMEKI